ncbi:hypothetical protein DMENIID0001_113370 [Sergentomyia squamirostris]
MADGDVRPGTCAMCKRTINQRSRPGVMCDGGCGSWYHSDCASPRISKRETLEFQRGEFQWICQLCLPAELVDDAANVSHETCQELLRAAFARIEALEKSIQGLTSSNRALSEEGVLARDDFSSKLRCLFDENVSIRRELASKVGVLTDESATLRTDIDAVKFRLAACETNLPIWPLNTPNRPSIGLMGLSSRRISMPGRSWRWGRGAQGIPSMMGSGDVAEKSSSHAGRAGSRHSIVTLIEGQTQSSAFGAVSGVADDDNVSDGFRDVSRPGASAGRPNFRDIRASTPSALTNGEGGSSRLTSGRANGASTANDTFISLNNPSMNAPSAPDAGSVGVSTGDRASADAAAPVNGGTCVVLPTDNGRKVKFKKPLLKGTSNAKVDFVMGVQRPASKSKWIFVTGFRPMTSAQEILDFIGLTLGKDNESGARCYKIRKRNQESVPASFKIGLSAPAYDAVSSVAFWPAGIFVKDFQFLGDRGPPLLNP